MGGFLISFQVEKELKAGCYIDEIQCFRFIVTFLVLSGTRPPERTVCNLFIGV
jgi:hypothetical protein